MDKVKCIGTHKQNMRFISRYGKHIYVINQLGNIIHYSNSPLSYIAPSVGIPLNLYTIDKPLNIKRITSVIPFIT